VRGETHLSSCLPTAAEERKLSIRVQFVLLNIEHRILNPRKAMPHTSTAEKRLRQNIKLRLKNRSVKKVLKLQIKKVAETAKSGTLDALKAEYNKAAMELDKAASRNIIHPNLAGRKKSQLARMVNAKAKAPAGAK
jgi:small subunit ribosomal protein S20